MLLVLSIFSKLTQPLLAFTLLACTFFEPFTLYRVNEHKKLKNQVKRYFTSPTWIFVYLSKICSSKLIGGAAICIVDEKFSKMAFKLFVFWLFLFTCVFGDFNLMELKKIKKQGKILSSVLFIIQRQIDSVFSISLGNIFRGGSFIHSVSFILSLYF